MLCRIVCEGFEANRTSLTVLEIVGIDSKSSEANPKPGGELGTVTNCSLEPYPPLQIERSGSVDIRKGGNSFRTALNSRLSTGC